MSDNYGYNDIEKIIIMLEYIRDMLYVFTDYYDTIVSKYPEFKNEFEKNRPQIKKYFELLTNILINHTNMDSLENEGLTRTQLNLKFLLLKSTYDDAHQEFLKYVDTTKAKSKKKGVLNRLRRKLGIFFKYGNSILGSLSDAGVPFVGAIGEFKDAAETLIERSQSQNK